MMERIENFKKLAEESGIPEEFLIRELLQKLLLLFLSKKNFFKEGVFQGGTCLRIVYNSPRFSEDLDFVFKQRDSSYFSKLEDILSNIENFITEKTLFTEKTILTLQKDSESFKRFKLNIFIKKLRKITINLEFANIPSYINDLEILSYDFFNFPVRKESLEEILSDKVVAFGLRNYIKGRDIWDIFFIKAKSSKEIKKDIILKKLEDYRSSPSKYKTRVKRNLTLLKERGIEILDNEMRKFLPREIYSIEKRNFKEIIKEVQIFIKEATEKIE